MLSMSCAASKPAALRYCISAHLVGDGRRARANALLPQRVVAEVQLLQRGRVCQRLAYDAQRCQRLGLRPAGDHVAEVGLGQAGLNVAQGRRCMGAWRGRQGAVGNGAS